MRFLTRAEEQIMQILWRLRKGFVKDIIEQLPEPKPAYNNVSTIVRILEKKGFVFRITNPHNRRQKLVSATQKAHRMADKLFEALQSASNVFVSDFTNEEQVTILNLMDRMITNATGEIYDQGH